MLLDTLPLSADIISDFALMQGFLIARLTTIPGKRNRMEFEVTTVSKQPQRSNLRQFLSLIDSTYYIIRVSKYLSQLN